MLRRKTLLEDGLAPEFLLYQFRMDAVAPNYKTLFYILQTVTTLADIRSLVLKALINLWEISVVITTKGG